MNQLLLVGLGGAIGSMARYLMSTTIYSIIGSNFPYGTLVVNVTGCFIIGLVGVFFVGHLYMYATDMRSFLIIGFLGGYTTFSSFSFETLNLLINGEVAAALLNVITSVFLCLFATWLGILLGRAI